MKLLLSLFAIFLVAGCSTMPKGSKLRSEHTIGFHDLKTRLRLTFQLPPEFKIDNSIGCNSPHILDGVLSCGAHEEGQPVLLGYFKNLKRGLKVSAWISVMDPILGPDELLASFTRHGDVKLIARREISLDGHKAILADLESLHGKPESITRFQRLAMFRLKNMAGGISMTEYQGDELSMADLDKFGSLDTQGVKRDDWKLTRVFDEILRSAKIYLPEE